MLDIDLNKIMYAAGKISVEEDSCLYSEMQRAISVIIIEGKVLQIKDSSKEYLKQEIGSKVFNELEGAYNQLLAELPISLAAFAATSKGSSNKWIFSANNDTYKSRFVIEKNKVSYAIAYDVFCWPMNGGSVSGVKFYLGSVDIAYELRGSEFVPQRFRVSNLLLKQLVEDPKPSSVIITPQKIKVAQVENYLRFVIGNIPGFFKYPASFLFKMTGKMLGCLPGSKYIDLGLVYRFFDGKVEGNSSSSTEPKGTYIDV